MRSVLLVEDDPAFAATLVRLLRRADWACEHAQNAEEAMSLGRQQAFESAIVDLKISEDSGLQLIEPLLALQPELRIVLLTGYASIPTAVNAIKLGASEYLAKPAELQAIIQAISGTAQESVESDAGQEQTELVPIAPSSPKRMEWEHIQRVLADHEGNISAAARAMGMHRRTLQRKLAKKPPVN